MDPNEVRRRRMQRFQAPPTPSTAGPVDRDHRAVASSSRNSSSRIDADEAFARRLQAELHAETQRPPPPKPSSAKPKTLEDDEAMARALQAQFDSEDGQQQQQQQCPPPRPQLSPAIQKQRAQENLPRAKARDYWQKNLSVKEVPDRDIMSTFSYQREVNMMSSTNPRRMKRILGEIKTLRESLPEGIFLRYAESRPDCMKIIIVGPQDTPYANGLFEFDLLCPANYPMSPPLMLLKTTGSGRYSFNPNLYSSGKVCLSLLGTWEGPQWSPQTSTILQVLVSIQGLILNAEPWTNEPGFELAKGTKESRWYNRQIHPKTVEAAMLSWLEIRHRGLWDEVVKKHFQSNEEQILKTVAAWKRDKPQPGEYTGGLGLNVMPGGFTPWDPPHGQPYGMGTVSTWASPGWGGPGIGSMNNFSPPGFSQPGAAGNMTGHGNHRGLGDTGRVIDESLARLVRQLKEALPELKDRRRVPPKYMV